MRALIALVRQPRGSRHHRAALFVALAATAAAGCGASGADRLTAAELAAQGSAICRQATAEERAIPAPSTRLALPRIAVISAHEIANLRKLSPPAEEQSTYVGLLSDFSQLNGLLQPLSSALVNGGSAPADLLSRGRELAGHAAALAGPLGLAACSQTASAE